MPPGYVPLDNPRRAVFAAFGVIVLVWLVSIVLGLEQILLYDRSAAGEFVADTQFEGASARASAIGTAQQVVFFAAAVPFIVWFHRAYGNLDVIAPEERRYGSGWAIGGWFVPVLWWWGPSSSPTTCGEPVAAASPTRPCGR